MKLIKLILIPLLIFASQFAILAQETPTGKKFAEDFWKFLNEGRLVAAEGRLDSIKRREPNFDASKMEKALADAKAKNEGRRADSRNALMAKVNAGNALDELFRSRVVQADSSDTLESIKSEIEKYSKKADEVLAVNRADIQSDLESSLQSLLKDLTRDTETNTKLLKSVNESIEAKHAEASYYELLLRQSYWETARRIFPDEADIVKAYNSITATINSVGTAEQRAANAEKNMNAKIDAERLPKAGQNNASLEKQFQNAFNSMNQARNLNYSFLRAVIISTDYGIVRNQLTGIVLGRYLIGSIAFKDKTGKCKLGRFRIDQSFVGSSFTGTWKGDFADFTFEMRCENVNK